MRHLTTVALMLNLGIASLYAQQPAEEHSRAGRGKDEVLGKHNVHHTRYRAQHP